MQTVQERAQPANCVALEAISLYDLSYAVEASKLRSAGDVDLDLIESIRKYGVLTPILASREKESLKIIDGWRVLQAALQIWRTTVERQAVKIPVIVDSCGQAELKRILTHIMQRPVMKVEECKVSLMNKLLQSKGAIKVQDVQCPVCNAILRLYATGALEDEKLKGYVADCLSLYRYALSYMTLTEAMDLLTVLRAQGAEVGELEKTLKERTEVEKRRSTLMSFIGKGEEKQGGAAAEPAHTAEPHTAKPQGPSAAQPPAVPAAPQRSLEEEAEQSTAQTASGEQLEEAEELEGGEEAAAAGIRSLELLKWREQHLQEIEAARERKRRLYSLLLSSIGNAQLADLVIALFTSDEVKEIASWFSSATKIMAIQEVIDRFVVKASSYLDSPSQITLTREGRKKLAEMAELFSMPSTFLLDELITLIYDFVNKFELYKLEDLKRRLEG
jgi:hypothetical protein